MKEIKNTKDLLVHIANIRNEVEDIQKALNNSIDPNSEDGCKLSEKEKTKLIKESIDVTKAIHSMQGYIQNEC